MTNLELIVEFIDLVNSFREEIREKGKKRIEENKRLQLKSQINNKKFGLAIKEG